MYVHTYTSDIALAPWPGLRSSMPGTSDMDTSTLPPGLLAIPKSPRLCYGYGWIHRARHKKNNITITTITIKSVK